MLDEAGTTTTVVKALAEERERTEEDEAACRARATSTTRFLADQVTVDRELTVVVVVELVVAEAVRKGERNEISKFARRLSGQPAPVFTAPQVMIRIAPFSLRATSPAYPASRAARHAKTRGNRGQRTGCLSSWPGPRSTPDSIRGL